MHNFHEKCTVQPEISWIVTPRQPDEIKCMWVSVGWSVCVCAYYNELN